MYNTVNTGTGGNVVQSPQLQPPQQQQQQQQKAPQSQPPQPPPAAQSQQVPPPIQQQQQQQQQQQLPPQPHQTQQAYVPEIHPMDLSSPTQQGIPIPTSDHNLTVHHPRQPQYRNSAQEGKIFLIFILNFKKS